MQGTTMPNYLSSFSFVNDFIHDFPLSLQIYYDLTTDYF